MPKEIILPTERSKAVNHNPKLLIIMGKPKSGKSSAIASLDSNLVIDLEDGYRALEVMKIQARTPEDLFAIKDAIIKKGRELKKKPYRFITIDNATRLEELALSLAADYYRNTPQGAQWGLKRDDKGIVVRVNGKAQPDPDADIRTLPQGGGYFYLRNAVKDLVKMFQPLCDTLILVCHVKDKQIREDSVETTELAVDLAGKLGDILCGEADAVGLIYREGNKTYISFAGGDNTIREARPLHLRGKKFVIGESDENNNLKMDLSKIFL